ncbi:unnamed protein product [Prorocentrum cordatum]|uniref:RNase H type-1 domain-containing protein n=1 Tax=Prorocentrum cordatum TaxID=2364126 RepID=A0ABN9VT20_9DINO|nr:unnamed protein product [Polarella glacialis]
MSPSAVAIALISSAEYCSHVAVLSPPSSCRRPFFSKHIRVQSDKKGGDLLAKRVSSSKGPRCQRRPELALIGDRGFDSFEVQKGPDSPELPGPRASWMPQSKAPPALHLMTYAVPRTTPKEVLDARGRFRAKTGLGEADWRPRPWRNQRADDWAQRGHSSERAARLQAMCCEAARADGYAVTYFDLVQCFEWVTHEKAWAAAKRWGFNPIIMRVVLRIPSMARRIVLDGCYTTGKAWQRGIVAGSRYAPFCLKMVIILELDDLVYRFPWADTCIFFDDHAMATHGLREFVQLDLAVSRGAEGKTVALTSNTALGDIINASCRRLGARAATHEKHLGATSAAGRRRRVGAIKKRALKFAARQSRIAAVRGAGETTQKLVRHAKVPALLYGSATVGMADSTLQELRTSVATAMPGCTKGRSTNLTLLSDDVDPGCLVNSGPIIAWATAWQEANTDEQLMERLQIAWRTWVMRVAESKAAYSITVGGKLYDLRYMLLQGLYQLVRTATQKQLKHGWVQHWGQIHGIEDIFIEPVRALLRRHASMRKGRRQMTFAEHAGRQHVQIVTVLLSVQLDMHIESELEADTSFNVELNLWNLESCDAWLTEGERHGLATGNIYTDGSLQFGDFAPLRRAGWGFIRIDDDLELEYGRNGHSILRAELYAMLQAIKVAAPPLRIFTDGQNVLDGLAKGPQALDRRSRKHQDLWDNIWAAVDDTGGVGPRTVSFCKVKAPRREG